MRIVRIKKETPDRTPKSSFSIYKPKKAEKNENIFNSSSICKTLSFLIIVCHPIQNY